MSVKEPHGSKGAEKARSLSISLIEENHVASMEVFQARNSPDGLSISPVELR